MPTQTNCQYGYPIYQREQIINNQCATSTNRIVTKYAGQMRELQVITVNIGLPVYRIENGRTKNFQKEYIATNNLNEDYFSSDPESIQTQLAQHQLLFKLVKEQNLLDSFKKVDFQQTEPIITTRKGVVVNGNRRLCAWRYLYYLDGVKYQHFQTIQIAVLPFDDDEAIRNLEEELQIQKEIKADYAWHNTALMLKENVEKGIRINDLAKLRNMKPKEIQTYIAAYNFANIYLEKIGHKNEWSLINNDYYSFKTYVETRQKINNPADVLLFEELCINIIQTATDDRKFLAIKDTYKQLSAIRARLSQEANSDGPHQEIINNDDLLNDVDDDQNENGSTIINYVRDTDVETITRIVNSTIEEQNLLQHEQDNRALVVKKLADVHTLLKIIVASLNDERDKNGANEQINNIEIELAKIKEWLN